MLGKRALFPPLSLITVASYLPQEWDVRLVDCNIEELREEDLAWCDVVFLSAMFVQKPNLVKIVERAKRLEKPIVCGGPYVTTTNDDLSMFDHVLKGECEDVIRDFLVQLSDGRAPRVVGPPVDKPDVSKVPTPRFDLLKLTSYLFVTLQFSRGCPFECEFCDIIEIFGRKPRTKGTDQFLRELDALKACGYVGSVMVVDDNFIGNKKAALALTRAIQAWNDKNGYPFTYITEASINLAKEDDLLQSMVAAGFKNVFIGIETPSMESLQEASKWQNTDNVDLPSAINKIVSSGLGIYAGMIVGFDSDGEDIFERQISFIRSLPIVVFTVSMLSALPGTNLWRRLAREGRLYESGSGVAGECSRPNFKTKLDEKDLVRGLQRIYESAYSADNAFERAEKCVALLKSSVAFESSFSWQSVVYFVRILFALGVKWKYRRRFWRFMWKAREARLEVSLSRILETYQCIEHTENFIVPKLASIKFDYRETIPSFDVAESQVKRSSRKKLTLVKQ